METTYFRLKICFLLPLLYLLPGLPFKAEAQLPGMRRYTLLDGYTAANGYVIQQDRKGFIWLGTENGAFRFDGKRFQVFRDKQRPADQEILSCNPYAEDQVLLVPLLNNITYYKDGVVISGRKDPGLNTIHNTGKNSVFLDAFTRHMWISDENRINTLYRFSAKGVQQVTVPDTSFRVVAIRNNQVICHNMQDSILKRYDLRSGKCSPLYDNMQQPVRCTWLIETKEDGRYIFNYDKPGGKFDIYTFQNDSVLHLLKTVPQLPYTESRSVFTDKHLNLWFRLLDGGITYRDSDRLTTTPLFRFMDKTMLNYVFIDREENIWMSAQNNSLYFLSRKHFKNALYVNSILPGRGIPKCIGGDVGGNMAIGYTNECIFSIRSNGKLKQFRLSQDFYEGVRCICPLGNNRFLIMDKDVALVDGNCNNIRYLHSPSSYKDMSLHGDSGLLVAYQSGVFYLDRELMGIAPKPVFKGRASAVAALPDGTVLVGTPDGLFIKKDLDADSFRIDHPVLSRMNITDIADKGKHGALISTNAQGIYFYDAQSGKAEPIRGFSKGGDGLVRRIFKQNDSLYWLATERGACEIRLNKQGKVERSRNYTFYDGLPSNNITSIYVHHDTAFIATAEGAGIIPLTDTAQLQMSPPGIYLNTVYLKDSVVYRPGSELKLPYSRNNFLISLSTISFESFGNTKYYYRLEGWSDDWTETDNPEIRFSGLAPGTYLFKAYASNAKGIRSREPVSLYIHITPAFWQTWLFKAAAFLVLLLLLYWLVRKRAVKLALGKYEKARQARRLAELELEAIKAQINPHFIYNCLNSIQYFNYEKQHDLARQYLDLFARLIRQTMEYSQQTFISIAEETDYLRNYLQLEKMRFHERLQYEIIVSDGLDQQLMVPAMLIQPYVENALKHGIAARRTGGMVIIRFEQPEQTLLLISIEDNGAGFGPEPGKKGSLGLRLSGSRAETYNQLFGMKIEIDFYNKKNDQPGQSGIIVQLKIPVISYEHTLL